MVNHLFTDLFGVLIFENITEFNTDLSNFTQLSNNLYLNQELLDFYSLLKKEKNISLNVFTSAFYLINKQGEFSQKYLKNFDHLFSSFELGYYKKETKSYELIAENIGVLPENCFFTDDQAIHIEKAREAGFTATQYLNNEQITNHLRGLYLL